MISKSLAKDVLNAALATGADFAEIYFEDNSSNVIVVENGRVDSAAKTTSSGVGLRVISGLKSVYGHTNDLSKNSLLKLAVSLASSFQGKQKIFVEKFKTKKVKTLNKAEIPMDTVPQKDIIEYLRTGSVTMHAFDPHIVKTNADMLLFKKHVIIYNSRSLLIENFENRSRLVLVAIAFDNGKIEQAFEGPGTQKGWEFFTKEINIKEVATKAAKTCITMLNAAEAPSGMMPVVIGHGWGGVLFHEACGHPLEAAAVSKGLSCFTPDMVGTKIASDVVTAYDDGTIPNEWGSVNVDDEGHKPHKTCLIKNGVLMDFMVDELNGKRMNHLENGSSRRQNYTFEPVSRMTNTYIANGKSTPEEIIKSVKLGLYTVGFLGGSVDPVTGEFNFSASEAYIIRDGKIAEPVRGATLIGKGNEILHQIDMVGNDQDLGQGNCGASSGSIPVNVGQPTIRLKSILVGGKGGELK